MANLTLILKLRYPWHNRVNSAEEGPEIDPDVPLGYSCGVLRPFLRGEVK